MSRKIHLGKTGDSRTRRKPKAIEADKIFSPGNGAYKDFYDYLLGKGFSSSSSKRYVGDVKNFTLWCEKENLSAEKADIPEGAVNYTDILYYLQSLKEKVKQKTAGIYLNSLKHYYQYLKSIGIVTENPVINVRIKGVKRRNLYNILSKEELDSLYMNFNAPTAENENQNKNWQQASMLVSKRNKVMLGLMIYQGLNTSELSKLQVKDIKLQDGKIYIAGSRRSNERTLTLESHQIMGMMEYVMHTRNELLKTTGKNGEKLFISNGTGENLQNAIQKLMKKLNKQNPKVKSMKHIRASVITNWLKRYNLRQTQYMAGHRFVSSTEQYKVNDIDDLKADIVKYHPLN